MLFQRPHQKQIFELKMFALKEYMYIPNLHPISTILNFKNSRPTSS